jgi:hypothetical protein
MKIRALLMPALAVLAALVTACSSGTVPHP